MPHNKHRTQTGRRPPGASRQRGFSLVELITVITIIAIAAAVAIPVMWNIIPKQNMKGAARDLYSAMMRAKAEALKRGAKVAVQINPDERHFFKIFVDNHEDGSGNGRVDEHEETIMLGAALPARVIFLGDSSVTAFGYQSTYPLPDGGNPGEKRTAIVFDHRGIGYMTGTRAGQAANGSVTLCVAKSSANQYSVGDNEAVYGYKRGMDQKDLNRLRDSQCRVITVNKTGRVRMVTYGQYLKDKS